MCSEALTSPASPPSAVLRGDARDLPALLREYGDEYGGLVVNWRLFGSSGHEVRREEGGACCMAATSYMPARGGGSHVTPCM